MQAIQLLKNPLPAAQSGGGSGRHPHLRGGLRGILHHCRHVERAFRQALVWLILVFAAGGAHAATFTVSSTAAAGAGTLADAITQANNSAGADTINFGIAGTGVKILTVPLNGYPTVTDTLVINGYTQAGAVENTAAAGSTNAVLRIEINGTAENTPGAEILRIEAPTTVRGLAFSNIQSSVTAVRIRAGGAGSSIRGCFFGTTAAGTASSSSASGISVDVSTQIGGSAPADRNLFADLSNAVLVTGSGTVIQGNLFGTFPNGSTGGSQRIGQGVSVLAGASALTIGGTAAGQGNVMRDVNGIAIRLFNSAPQPTGVSILGNSIDGVTNVPIDLGIDGVDPIDPGDGDTGPNGRENTATMFYARKHGTQLLVQLQVDGNFTGGTKRVELFASPAAHVSGSGPGAVLLASVGVNPTGIAVAFIDLSVSVPTLSSLALPQVVTATVTNADGSTSEFSNAVPLIDGGQPRVVTNTNDSGAGSLRQAMLDANSNPGMDAISFNISGSGPHTIAPLNALPTINGDLIIDGYTQNGSKPNSAVNGSNADLRIALDGSSIGGSNLLAVASGQLSVRGLNLRNSGNNGVLFSGGSNHTIEGCFIGTGIDGTGDQGSIGNGVGGAANGVQVGGPGLHQRNLISGNNSAGVNLSGNDWLVQNNVIGTAADGTTGLQNSLGGVVALGTGGRIIGNRIRNNGTRGIGLPSAAVRVEIAANAIFGNAALGIDLNNDGITLNDPDDADSGPNGLQNFPVLTSVTSLANGTLRVEGTLDRPSGGSLEVRFDLFRSTNCDSTHGEGEIYLGASTVFFPPVPVETFSVDMPGANLPAGSVITATATTGGATSEFSACAISTLPPDPVYANGFE